MNHTDPGLADDQIQIWNATIDWSGTPSITVVHDTDLQAAAFDSNLCDYGACIPQPGTTRKLQTLSDRIMFRPSTATSAAGRRWSPAIRSMSAAIMAARAGTTSRSRRRRLGDARSGHVCAG